jgi:hypothetical protein
MNIVINQPCYLPWRGYFALIKRADIFVFYDDVQLPQGRSFQTRVQIKTRHGTKWLTVPIKRSGRISREILETQIHDENEWCRRHYAILKDSLSSTPYWHLYDPLVKGWFDHKWSRLADLTIKTTVDITNSLNIKTRFLKSSELGIKGGKTERLVDICKYLGATRYISPQGSVKYMRHELFEDIGVEVEYLDYDNTPYPQAFGPFDPFVTILDLLANVGPDADNHINSKTIPWKKMIDKGSGGRKAV